MIFISKPTNCIYCGSSMIRRIFLTNKWKCKSCGRKFFGDL